jgi:hypothetical protein
MKKGLLIIIVILLVIGGITAWNIRSARPANQQTVESNVSPTATKVFSALPELMPEAHWSEPVEAKKETFYGNIPGVSRTATIKTQEATVPHFGQSVFFRDLGYDADKNLAADGPGSSQWGYVKNVDGKKQIVTFGYHVKPTNSNPNEPLQFDCPCQTTMTVFVSN